MKRRLVINIAIGVIAIAGILVIFSLRGKSAQQTTQAKASPKQILNKAFEHENEGSFLEAKESYVQLVNDFPNSGSVENWQKKIWDINIGLLFSPTHMPGSVTYKIKSGDSLAKIAKKFNTTVGLLKRSNNLKGDTIIIDRTLKVWTKPFSIVVDKSQNILILESDDQVLKIYVVATGINNCTPVGTFRITTKLVDPPWFKAGAIVPPESPDNILGSRWLGLDAQGYGIHGTIPNGQLGKQITQGCVRMSNSDVEELFDIVPRGAEVTIVD